jgi:hypothetical protein
MLPKVLRPKDCPGRRIPIGNPDFLERGGGVFPRAVEAEGDLHFLQRGKVDSLDPQERFACGEASRGLVGAANVAAFVFALPASDEPRQEPCSTWRLAMEIPLSMAPTMPRKP